MAAVLADPALVALLSDPEVTAGVAAIQASPDPSAALRAVVGGEGGEVGRKVGALFARMAALAAARCDAVAEAEEKESERKKPERASAAGIVPLPCEMK